MDVLNLILKCLLIILLILQIILMIYLFYINHKTFKREKECWVELDKKIQKVKEHAQLYLNQPLEENNKEENEKKS